MYKQLPPKPDLKVLKLEASRLLHSHDAGDVGAFTRIQEFFPRLGKRSHSDIGESKFTLRDAQLVIAREYGFESWPKLKGHVERVPGRNHQLLIGRVAERIAKDPEKVDEIDDRLSELLVKIQS